MRQMIFVFFIVFSAGNVFSQKKSIIVKDKDSNEGLIGANIQLGNTQYVTDIEGRSTIEFLKFPCILSLSYVGYQSKSINLSSFDEVSEIIYLSFAENALNLVTVTGTKYEQNLSKATVSVDILKPDLLRSVNANSADEILNKVPGVQVLDRQANIRGGSGYSYGAGSRVMLLIDDIPALQVDAGFPNWSDIPIENLSQIEVVKGASSTLYGSSAMNGIINYRSSYAKSEPETRLSTSGTYFMSPKDPDKKWWGDSIRYETNIAFVHKEKVDKFDFIASGFYNRLRGFNQFTDEDRARANLNVRYRYSDKLTIGMNTIVNMGKNNSFFLWKNPGSGAMTPLAGTVSDRKSRRIYIDPTLTYIDKNIKHKFLWRTISIKNENNTNQSNSSTNHYGEYQVQKNIESIDLVMTAGVVGSWGQTDSQILGDTTFYADSYAGYLQLDKKFNKLTLNGGLRYEYISQRSPAEFMGTIIPDGKKSKGKLISRLAANYEIAEYTFIRASYGEGYRFPTLTERFVTTSFGNFAIFSNPELEPESGWSSELGIKQGFSLGGFKGFVDVSGFISEYDDMIEFTFVFEPNRIGFQPRNIGNTRISGYEIGIVGQANLLGIPINIFGGYTYINPIYKNYDQSEQVRQSVSENVNVLKYRSKHLFKMDCEAKFWKMKWGVSVQRASHVINIDKAFESVPPINFDIFGIAQYRDINNTGYTLLDSRISIKLNKLTITGLVNNILNKEYTLRPALVEAPRNIGLRLDWEIN